MEMVIESIWFGKVKEDIANLSESYGGNSNKVCVVEARIRFGQILRRGKWIYPILSTDCLLGIK